MELEKLSFEEAYAKLEEIVRELEDDKLTIDRSVALYEQGMQLVRYCGERLSRAELRISQLVQGADGEPRLTPLQ